MKPRRLESETMVSRLAMAGATSAVCSITGGRALRLRDAGPPILAWSVRRQGAWRTSARQDNDLASRSSPRRRGGAVGPRRAAGALDTALARGRDARRVAKAGLEPARHAPRRHAVVEQ